MNTCIYCSLAWTISLQLAVQLKPHEMMKIAGWQKLTFSGWRFH